MEALSTIADNKLLNVTEKLQEYVLNARVLLSLVNFEYGSNVVGGLGVVEFSHEDQLNSTPDSNQSIQPAVKCVQELIPSIFYDLSRIPSIQLFNLAYVFPIQFAVGVFSNLLFIITLARKRAWSKTNYILAALATADMMFFLSLCPVKFRLIESLRTSYKFYWLWVHAHVPALALANWFSATSIWLTVALSVERYIVVKYPLKAKSYLRKRCIVSLILIIIFCAFLTTSHLFVGRCVETLPLCNPSYHPTSDLSRLPPNQSLSPGEILIRSMNPNYQNESVRFDLRHHKYTKLWRNIMKYYFKVSLLFSVVAVILLPLVCLLILNISLIKNLLNHLRVHTQLVAVGSASTANTEHRVTTMVVAMISCFIIANIPSGVIHVIDISKCFHTQKSMIFYNAVQVSNMLVTTGKMVNFFLYSCASYRFRRQLQTTVAQGWRQHQLRWAQLNYFVMTVHVSALSTASSSSSIGKFNLKKASTASCTLNTTSEYGSRKSRKVSRKGSVGTKISAAGTPSSERTKLMERRTRLISLPSMLANNEVLEQPTAEPIILTQHTECNHNLRRFAVFETKSTTLDRRLL